MKLQDLLKVVFLVEQLCRLSAATGDHAGDTNPVYAMEGELVALKCPLPVSRSNPTIIWKLNTTQGYQELRENSGSQLKQWNQTLLILKAVKEDSGTYTCSVRNGDDSVMQASTNLTVLSNTCFRGTDIYFGICFVGKSCSFANKCTSDIPFTKVNITWFKNCQTKVFSLEENIYIEAVTKSDAGNYTCKHYFKYEGQVYYMSATTKLTVRDYVFPLQPKIIKPQRNEVIEVDVGKPTEIQCLILLHNGLENEFLQLHWISGSSMVSTDKALDVFYNSTQETIHGTAYLKSWLVFKNVSKSHLNSTYTCKLESALQERINVSVTLKEKVSPARPHSLSLSLGLAGICVVLVVIVTVICYKMRIYIVLFFRDLQGVPSSPTDGKEYDAYISYYEACSEEALTEEEVTLLLHTMETKYGFRLCVYHRNVLPGGAVVDEVLENVKQSRRLILVPRDHGPQPEDQYGLWNGLHTALVERETRLVLIQRALGKGLSLLPEPLRMLVRSGHAITWRGSHSAHHSSPFWKHLLYHMPPRRRQQEDKQTLL